MRVYKISKIVQNLQVYTEIFVDKLSKLNISSIINKYQINIFKVGYIP